MRRRGVLAGVAAAVATAAFRLHAAEVAPPAGSEIQFELVGTDGRVVRGADLRGRWLLVFFGYTSCPDLCPTALSEITGALAQLGPLASRVRPVFVSIDPEHDTLAALRAYAQGFDDRILPLTGTADQLAAAARAFGVVFSKIAGAAPGEYTFAHSAIITLVGPEGGLVARFSSDTSADRIAWTVRALVDGSHS